jgi:chromate reductase
MAKPHLAVIVGSNRRESINRRLAHAVAKLGEDEFDASFVRIDDLPMFNQDNEGNPPAEVVRFKNELARADAILIVTPEHDRSIPAVLKNAVDWGARPYGKNSWTGKPAFITGTSPGAIGTALAQQHLRPVMTGLGMILLAVSPILLSSRTSSTIKGTSLTRARGNFSEAFSIASPRL